MTDEEKIASLELDIENIKKEMAGEKSFSVDGKISVNKRSVSELSQILGLKKQELSKLTGIDDSPSTFGGINHSGTIRRGGFD